MLPLVRRVFTRNLCTHKTREPTATTKAALTNILSTLHSESFAPKDLYNEFAQSVAAKWDEAKTEVRQPLMIMRQYSGMGSFVISYDPRRNATIVWGVIYRSKSP